MMRAPRLADLNLSRPSLVCFGLLFALSPGWLIDPMSGISQVFKAKKSIAGDRPDRRVEIRDWKIRT